MSREATVGCGSATAKAVRRHVRAMFGVLWLVAALVAGGAHAHDNDDSKLVLLLGVSRPTLVTGRPCHAIEVTLFLQNEGQEPAYVSPVIGQMASTFKIKARSTGTRNQPTVLYSMSGGKLGAFHRFEDLFTLLPKHTLKLQLTVPYGGEGLPLKDGSIEIWAEYDFRDMKNIDPRAAGAILKSEPEIADLKFVN